MMGVTESTRTFEALQELIPGGVNSPVRSFPGLGRTPLVAKDAKGDLLIDVDGNCFLDLCCSWGALLHGHGHSEILDAVRHQLERGTSYGVTSVAEERLARKVRELMPTMERVRFVSSGTEATMSAVRLARGFTGRSRIIKFAGNYHGHADCFLVEAGSGLATANATSSSAGVPQGAVADTVVLPYNDCEALETGIDERVAAAILEPVAANMGVVPASLEFLKALRAKTEEVGALLIFDEVVTAFRVAKGGAMSLYGIRPDLTCIGKIVGGGFPAAGFGGRRDVMERLAPIGDVYQAGTLSGNPIAMAAGFAALELLDRPGFYEEMERKMRLLLDPVCEAIQRLPCCLKRAGSMFTLFFGGADVANFEDVKRTDREWFKRYFTALFDQGIYVSPSQFEASFVSAAHTDAHLEDTAQRMVACLKPL